MARSAGRLALALALVIAAPCPRVWAEAANPPTTKPAPQTAPTKHKPIRRKHATTAAKPGSPPQPKPAAPPAVLPAAPKTAAPQATQAKPADAKFSPHFAALRADKVYLRTGPSADFPVQWVYVRKGLPVEVIAVFDIWRKIRDVDGAEGWVNQQLLTGRRSVLITGEIRDLRHDPQPDARIVARLEPGVIASVSRCDPAWCELRAGGYQGWLKREEVWGVSPGEVIE